MTYTTQGYMTAADLADHQQLTDTAADPNCPGHDDGRCTVAMNCPGRQPAPMGTFRRAAIYARRGKMTARQRRRLVKKAGRDPEYAVIRDDGMGYSRAMQGYREIVQLPVPVSGGPF